MKQEKRTIRRMCEADVDLVAVIEADCFSQPWSRQGFLDALQMDSTRYLVAECDGTICGYCGYYRSFEEAEIVNVAVAKNSRRKKLAYELLCRLLEEGEAEGVSGFFLEVRAHNEPAIALYKKLGFQEVGVRKGFYEQPREDALLMQKTNVCSISQ